MNQLKFLKITKLNHKYIKKTITFIIIKMIKNNLFVIFFLKFFFSIFLTQPYYYIVF